MTEKCTKLKKRIQRIHRDKLYNTIKCFMFIYRLMFVEHRVALLSLKSDKLNVMTLLSTLLYV